MAVKVTVVSTKGGVGKTTVTANLGALLADLGQKVLLIDGDVQPSLSSYYPITVPAAQDSVNFVIDALRLVLEDHLTAMLDRPVRTTLLLTIPPSPTLLA